MNSAPLRRIATEEAFIIPEVSAGLQQVAAGPSRNSDMQLVRRIYASKDTYYANFFQPLQDLGELRLRDMDDNGVDMQVLSLTAPGVQLFDADTAT
ncbi:hydrolase, partial [bacterium]